MTGEPFIRRDFSAMVARRIYPAMAQAGLRRQGKRVWWEQHADDAWVLLEMQMSKWTTRRELGFTINTAVWPPGTFSDYQSRVPQWAEPIPPISAGSPIFSRPRTVAAHLWPWDEFREFDISADLDQIGAETLRFMLVALNWARERSKAEAAFDRP